MEMGSMGEEKHGFRGWKFVVEEVLAELGFLPLYRLLDFCQPIGRISAVELEITQILTLERSSRNFFQLYFCRDFRLMPSSACNVTIFEKSFQIDFWKVPI